MADKVTCPCPACRVADHAAQVATEATGVASEADAIGLLLAAVVKAGRKAGWSGGKIAHTVLTAGGHMLVEQLAETGVAGTSGSPPQGPARGQLH